jgi:hypothetical protein
MKSISSLAFVKPAFPAVLFLQIVWGIASQPLWAGDFSLSGRALEKGTKNPLGGATVTLEALGNTTSAQAPSSPGTPTEIPFKKGKAKPPPTSSPVPIYSAQTDPKGNYRLSLPEGDYRLVVEEPGYAEAAMPLLSLHQDKVKDFYLEPEEVSMAEVVVYAPKETQVSQESLSKDELTSVAGSVGDVLRAVQTLPGVINAGTEYGGLLVRGSGPFDNLYLVDRIPIAFPFHFGGAISTLDSALIEDLNFITGGQDPQYTNALGGVVDVSQRDPRQDRWGFRADVNLLMSEAEVEGPVTPDSSLVLAGRRSYLDLLIGNLSNNSFTAIPVFADYQVKYAWEPVPGRHLDFDAFGSNDKVGVNVNGATAEQDPILGGNFNFQDGYNSQGVNYLDTTDSANSFRNTLYHSNSFLDESFGGGLYLDSTLEDFGDWFSWEHDFDKDDQLEAGLQYDYLLNGTNAYFVVFPTEYDEPNFTATTAPKVTALDTLSSSDFGAYFDQKFRLFDRKLKVSVGARADYLTYNSQATWGPRFSAAYLLTGKTTLEASYGYYNEAPSRIEGNTYLDPFLGNPHLGSEQSVASVVGVEQSLEQGLSVRVEGYEKDFSKLIVGALPPLNYTNEGTGRARGIEVFLRREHTDRFFGWISYSLSDSQRQDGPGLPQYPYDFSEPNNLQVVANYKLNPGWDTGFKFLYSSGLPYTPVILGSYSSVNGSFYVPNTGPINSQRLPDYVRLDVSTSLKTTYDTWEWRVYLEIINVLNNKDVLGYQYNANYTQQSAVLDLPFLPYLGFEAKY